MPTPMLRGLTVLLVEDDNDTRQMLAESLRQSGGTVIEAGSSQAAIAMLWMETSERKRIPDVMVIDLALPDLSGWELLKQIRKLPLHLGGNVPAIAISGHSEPADV